MKSEDKEDKEFLFVDLENRMLEPSDEILEMKWTPNITLYVFDAPKITGNIHTRLETAKKIIPYHPAIRWAEHWKVTFHEISCICEKTISL
jgi:hypothetical protein